MTVFNRENFLKKLDETDHEIYKEGEFFVFIRASGFSCFSNKFYYIHSIEDADYFYKECGAIFCSRNGAEVIFRKREI